MYLALMKNVSVYLEQNIIKSNSIGRSKQVRRGTPTTKSGKSDATDVLSAALEANNTGITHATGGRRGSPHSTVGLVFITMKIFEF